MVETCDIAVIGGGMGGAAAALSACNMGCSVILTEETDWLGGQMTSQGVSALDEHKHIESFGGTRSYNELKSRIRTHYAQKYDVPEVNGNGVPLNPGNGWVSRLCFEPEVGERVIRDMLRPHLEAGRLKLFCNTVVQSARQQFGHVSEIVIKQAKEESSRVQAGYYLDATETGDLLPHIGLPYVMGAEGREDTLEPHAPESPDPGRVQSFTFPFAVEYCPGEDYVIDRPENYQELRDTQPYSFTLLTKEGSPLPYKMFEHGPGDLLPFWSYRRLIDGQLLGGATGMRDISMINWAGNDYRGGNILLGSPKEKLHILEEAKRLSLGFLYWLQTEAPRDDGQGRGYRGLRLLPEVMGTADGLSKFPYIRESRRIIALGRVVEQVIACAARPQGEARRMPDSVGLGLYPIDIHPCVGGHPGLDAATFPFQIPFGALVPAGCDNLLAACKNIGVTHITNGSYRLHPVEWNIGESAGAIAAFCLRNAVSPKQLWEEFRKDPRKNRLRQLQEVLLELGIPLAWTLDVPPASPSFMDAQLRAVEAAL